MDIKKMRKKIFGLFIILYISIYWSGRLFFVGATEVDAEQQCFDALYYAKNNPDVVAVFGDNEEQLFAHYMEYGRYEGRNASKDFNLLAYQDRYEDLRSVFGDNFDAYPAHYLEYGIGEGRIAAAEGAEPVADEEWKKAYLELIKSELENNPEAEISIGINNIDFDGVAELFFNDKVYSFKDGQIIELTAERPEKVAEENEEFYDEAANEVANEVIEEVIEKAPKAQLVINYHSLFTADEDGALQLRTNLLDDLLNEYQNQSNQDDYEDEYYYLPDYLFDSDYELFRHEDERLYPERESSEHLIYHKSDATSSIEMITYDLTPMSVAFTDWGEAYYYIYLNYTSSRMRPGFRLMDLDFDGVPEFFILSDALNPFIFSFKNGEVIGTALSYRENKDGYALDRSKMFECYREKSTDDLLWMAESSGGYREIGGGNYIKNYALDMIDFDHFKARTIMEWELVVISTTNKATGHKEFTDTYIVKEGNRRHKMNATEFALYKEDVLANYEHLKTPNVSANKWNFTDNDEVVAASFKKYFKDYTRLAK